MVETANYNAELVVGQNGELSTIFLIVEEGDECPDDQHLFEEEGDVSDVFDVDVFLLQEPLDLVSEEEILIINFRVVRY